MIKFISRIITILVGGYILFNFIQFQGGKNLAPFRTISSITKKDETNNPPPYSENAGYIEKTLTNVFMNILKSKEGANFIQNINLPSNQNEVYLSYTNKEPISYIKEIKEGRGIEAICNDRLNLSYKIYNQDRELIQSKQNVTVTLDDKLDQDLKIITTKRKAQQEFEAQIYNTQPNQLKQYDVRINNIIFNPNNIRNKHLVQKSLQVTSGTGKKIFCNDKLKLKFTLEANSIESRNVKEMVTSIGSADLPAELTEIILGQRIGSQISFITNKNMINLIKPYGKRIFDTTKIKDDIFLILTIELIEEK